jgi:hypothetical protein
MIYGCICILRHPPFPSFTSGSHLSTTALHHGIEDAKLSARIPRSEIIEMSCRELSAWWALQITRPSVTLKLQCKVRGRRDVIFTSLWIIANLVTEGDDYTHCPRDGNEDDDEDDLPSIDDIIRNAKSTRA